MPNTALEKTTNTLNTPAHTSMEDVGKTNIQTLPPRSEGLTENQLTAIASRLLLKMPTLSCGQRKIHSDGVNPYGHEDFVESSVQFQKEIKKEVLDAALRMSPASDTLRHITRLATHKPLGTSEKDRSIRLYDCAQATRHYSEFVVYISCRMLWEHYTGQWFPPIGIITALCESMHLQITELHRNLTASLAAPPTPKARAMRADDWPDAQIVRREVCDFLIIKGYPDYFDDKWHHSNYFLEGKARGLGWRKNGE